MWTGSTIHDSLHKSDKNLLTKKTPMMTTKEMYKQKKEIKKKKKHVKFILQKQNSNIVKQYGTIISIILNIQNFSFGVPQNSYRFEMTSK